MGHSRVAGRTPNGVTCIVCMLGVVILGAALWGALVWVARDLLPMIFN